MLDILNVNFGYMFRIRIAVLEDNSLETLPANMKISEFRSEKYQYDLMGVFEKLNELLSFLDTDAVDVILSDIFIDSHPIGLELLKKGHVQKIPVILMTHSQKKEVFSEAQRIRSVYYLIKPFHTFTLQSVIDSVFEWNQRSKQYDFIDRKFLFLSGKGGQREQVLFDEIIYLESEVNYCFVYTLTKKYVLKKSLSKMLSHELDERFIRIHQRYAVNKKQVLSVRKDSLELSGLIELPLGKSFQKRVREFVKMSQ